MLVSTKETVSFEDIFEYTNNGVLVTDAHGFITHSNGTAEKLLNLSGSDHFGENILSVIPLIGKPIQECLQTYKPVLACQVSEKQAQLILNVSPVVKNKLLLGAICIFQELSIFEVSAQKTSSYQTLNRQLEMVFESSSDGIWVCDGSGVVISINKASEALNGIKASAVIGNNVADLLKSKIFDQSVTTKVMASKSKATVMQFIAKTQKYLLSTGTPSIDEQGNVALIVINERDMTELNTLRKQFEQSQKVKEKYQEELTELSFMDLERNPIIAESSKMRQVLQMSLKLSHIGASNILILGESGTGKSLLAKLIHKNSNRKNKAFVEINCAALPENLLEAELFGYEKGAFTGASAKGKVGLLEMAQGGTLFLDEIGDMPILLQSKLLKYLDNHEIRRVGGTETIKVNCSTIAATNQNLNKLVKNKQFREDLYYRLNSFILKLPPLNEREEDIVGLFRFYLNEFNHKYKCSKTIGPKAMRKLLSYSFPGNIRELKSIVENAVVMSGSNKIDGFIESSIAADESISSRKTDQPIDLNDLNLSDKLERVERQILSEAKKKFRTTREMATALGVSQPTVVRKLQKYKI